MGQQISYFTSYHGKENIVTNYCGVMLKMIYDESPKAFERIINEIIGGNENPIYVGPRFTQQEKHISSIPDLTVKQQSFNIFFENKTRDWFYDGQIDTYISNLDQSPSVNVLILLCSEFSNSDFLKSVQDKGKDRSVYVSSITYDDFLELIENNVTSDFVLTQLAEFRDFLDQEGLLPNWKYRFDVVNCANVSLNLCNETAYICPDRGGSYSHQRAKYFGAYKDKKVHHVYTISAIVVVPENLGEPQIKWKNEGARSNKELEGLAKTLVAKYRRDENLSTPLQVFILDNEREVSFVKDTAGGLWGSKIYFHDIARKCKSIDDLVDIIDNKRWSEFNQKAPDTID